MKKTEITFDMGLIIYISSTNEEKIHERNPLKIFRSFILFYNWAEKYQVHLEGRYFNNKFLKLAWTSIAEVGMTTWHVVNKQKSFSKIEMQTKMEDVLGLLGVIRVPFGINWCFIPYCCF